MCIELCIGPHVLEPMCVQWTHVCAAHNGIIAAVVARTDAEHSLFRAFAFCYCFPFSFSHYAVQLLLLLFRTFVFGRSRVPYEIWKVNKDGGGEHRRTHALCHRIRFGCDFGAMPTHFLIVAMRICMASCGRMQPSLLFDCFSGADFSVCESRKIK